MLFDCSVLFVPPSAAYHVASFSVFDKKDLNHHVHSPHLYLCAHCWIQGGAGQQDLWPPIFIKFILVKVAKLFEKKLTLHNFAHFCRTKSHPRACRYRTSSKRIPVSLRPCLYITLLPVWSLPIKGL